MKPPNNFRLDHFFVKSLNLSYKDPSSPEVQPDHERCQFDYNVNVHTVEKHRFRLTFKTKIQEEAPDESLLGMSVESELVGFFSMEESIPPEEKEKIIRINGISVLYGILRGIVSASSGVFPKGYYMLPTIDPVEIVKNVEKLKQESAKRATARSKTTNPSKKKDS